MSILSERVHMFLRACYAKGLSPRTIEWYEWQLNEYVDYVEMCDLPWGASETIDILFAHLRESGQSKHTVHAYYRTLRRFFNWLEMRRRLTNENPMNMIESPEKPKPYPQGVTVATVEKLLQSIESDTFLSRRDRAIIVFLWDTGVRASELCNLSMRDLNMGRREVLIRNGKGDKDRHVPFGLVVQKILENWLEVRGEANCDRVFVNRCRNPLTRSGVYDLLRRRKNEVGVEEPCNPHAFRHGFAIEFLENGGNIHNLQNLMGHETLRSTEIYLKATDRRARRDHRKASPGDHLNI